VSHSPFRTPAERTAERAQKREAVLRAAVRMFNERGFHAASLDDVAASLGVSKPTIYLRYRNKADLATAALASITQPSFDEPLPDGTREALIDHLRRFEMGVSCGLGVVGTLLGGRSAPELLELHRERVISRCRARGQEILRRAQDRGEVRRDADLETALEMLVGSYFARCLAGGTTRGWAETAVDTLLRGLAR